MLTTDILVQGMRRDAVYGWLSDPAHHKPILEGAFASLSEQGPGQYDVEVVAGPRRRTLSYRFDRPDDSHGGRRVYIQTMGKRFQGTLSYSLRTMKPSTNTLVTLHFDFDPGGLLGQVALAAGLEDALQKGLKTMLNNLVSALPTT